MDKSEQPQPGALPHTAASRNNPSPAAADIFIGGGEMGMYMRAFDWATSPLGPVANWSHSLRTAVSMCLHSHFPIIIWWGPKLVIFYNDAYRPVLGAKHPAALGQCGQEYWTEVWPVIGPMLHGVLETGQATWSDDLLLLIKRQGYLEECYFTFSYSPIPAESGGVGGVFTPVADTTERVINARRLRTLRDLAAQMAEARGEGEACRIAAEVLTANPYDIPFALLYLLDDAGQRARLVPVAGKTLPQLACPAEVALKAGVETSGGWPLARVVQTGQTEQVHELHRRFGPLPHGAWLIPPQTALVLPISLPGGQQPSALLVAGVSPHKALDDSYHSFFDSVASQIALSMAEARALAQEHQRAEALAALDRAKTSFFSNVSHEFRTPLTLLLGSIEDILARDGAVIAVQRKEMALVQRSGLRLLKLVNSLLDFTRIEADRVEAVYQPTDLARLTKELASMFQSAIEGAGLRLVIGCSPLPEPVYVDRDMWEKIVLNLLSNAFKFTFSGEICVDLALHAEHVALSVRDTGTGIRADEIPHIFERFHRIQGARGRTLEGAGIGLALVRELVKFHHGEIHVESVYGQGTTFRLFLPRGSAHLPADHIGKTRPLAPISSRVISYVEEALHWLPESEPGSPSAWEYVLYPPSPVEPRRQPPSAEASAAREARILVTDDNADMRVYLSHLLGTGYHVETAPDGVAALAIAQHHPPDLIVTDIMMPRLDGFQLLQQLRANDHTSTIPIILLSARAGEESRVEGLAAGADDYVVKPFSARELLARVDVHLKMAVLRKHTAESLRRAGEELEHRVQERTAALQEANTKLQIAIAERHRIEDKLREQERLAAIGTTTAKLTHEIANPLNGMSITLQFLGRYLAKQFNPSQHVPLQEGLHDLEQEIHRLSSLLQEMRSLGRPSQLALHPTDVACVVAKVLKTQFSHDQERVFNLEQDFPATLPLIVADQEKLHQVLLNLCKNAVEAMPEGGTLSLRGSSAGAQVCVEVRDTGGGIPEGINIFEPFTTTKPGGTGLGLAIVRQLVEAQGGTISYTSALGQGTTFILTLPAVQTTNCRG